MLLEPISINGKPQGKCFARQCKDCAWYRKWEVMDRMTRKKTHESKCSWEAILYTLPDLVGSVDGAQKASNEARNRSIATKKTVEDFTDRTRKTFAVLSQIRMIGGGDGQRAEDGSG